MPSAAERQVLVERESRNAARTKLDGMIGRMRGDIEERGIGGRIAEEAGAKALAALDEAALVANQSKGIIGGTVALVLLWVFRRPILEAFAALLARNDRTKEQTNDEQD